MEEKDPQEEKIKEEVKSSSIAYYKVLWRFLRTMLSIREGTDTSKTTEEIKKNIVFKGPSIWILICSVFIASIGLNVNSTAVVIGAMLISPLMAPIIGIGLSIGTNDFTLLTRSLKNFAIMVIVSLVTSYIYFNITPLSEVQSELFARTKPTLLDVLLAIFGGLAGIIAGSRDEKNNVVPGVAIATALMPPLCTAGYGLATGHLDFFYGAFYLFIINSVFICLATFVVVRYLKFPMAEFINPDREKKVKMLIYGITLVIILPSGFTFYTVVKESVFKAKAETFISDVFNLPATKVMSKTIEYDGDKQIIEVFLIGEILQESTIEYYRSQLADFEIPDAKLVVHQAKDASGDIKTQLQNELKGDILEDLYRKNEEVIIAKNKEIEELKAQLQSYQSADINYKDLQSELAVQYSDIESFSYATMKDGNLAKVNPTEVFTFIVKWKSHMTQEAIAKQEDQLQRYLKVRLKKDVVRVISE